MNAGCVRSGGCDGGDGGGKTVRPCYTVAKVVWS